ncbi:MAG: ABC transporter permease, partial [Kiritimatiellia bacterium]
VYISSNRALALWFAAGAMLAFVVFRFLTALLLRGSRFLPRPSVAPLRFALASIQRPGSAAGSIVFALGLGLTTLVIIAQVQATLNRLVMETLPQDAPAFFVMDIQGQQVDDFVASVRGHASVLRVDYSPVLRGRITSIKGIPVSEASIDPSVRWAVRGDRFMTFRETLPQGNQLVRGRWWHKDDEISDPQVSITADIGAGLGLEPGDRLGVNVLGREIEAVVANWRSVDWGSLQLNFALVFHPGALAGAPASWLASVHTDGTNEGVLFRAITSAFPNVTVIGTRDVLAQAARTINRIGMAFRAVGGVALLAGFLVLAGAVAADQQRRIREAVIAKVCGATRRDLMLALLAEFSLLALAGLLLSLIVGSVAGFGIIHGLMKIEYTAALPTVMAYLLPGIALVILIGVAGTWHVLGQSPARHLREE